MAVFLLMVFSQCAICLEAKWEGSNVLPFSPWLLPVFVLPLLGLEDERFEYNLREGPESYFSVGA